MGMLEAFDWTCPVTGTVIHHPTPSLPAGWMILTDVRNGNGESFSPGGLLVAARRIVANPRATLVELAAPATASELSEAGI